MTISIQLSKFKQYKNANISRTSVSKNAERKGFAYMMCSIFVQIALVKTFLYERFRKNFKETVHFAALQI